MPVETSANAGLLRRRWPAVAAAIGSAPRPGDVREEDEGARTLRVEGIRLASARDRAGEARLQARLVPEGAREAWVYGLALGDLPRALLSRARLERLVVVVLDLSLARASLERFDHSDWLADPRVSLELGGAADEVRRPFAAAPAALRLARGAATPLRDRVALELETPFLCSSLAELDGVLEAARAEVAGEGDVAELFGAWPGARVHLAAAGPTLANGLERLGARPADEPLVAVDAALGPLLAAGVRPDVVVSIESRAFGVRPFFDLELAPCRGSALVLFPVVDRGSIARWPGRRLVAYADHPRYDALRRERPCGSLWCAGSVLHAAADLAVRAGAAEVVLSGADFCFPGGASHVAGSAWSQPMAPHAIPGVTVADGHGRPVPTWPNLRGYLRDFERFVARHPGVRFWNASRDGARIAGVGDLGETAGVG